VARDQAVDCRENAHRLVEERPRDRDIELRPDAEDNANAKPDKKRGDKPDPIHVVTTIGPVRAGKGLLRHVERVVDEA